MKKLKLSDLSSEEILSSEELGDVFVSFSGSGSGSGSGTGSGSGSGSVDCGENAYYDNFISRCVCNNGYYYSLIEGKCVEGIEPPDPDPKITACIGKQRYDRCAWIHEGEPYTGRCDYRFASVLYCIDTEFT